MDRSSERGPLVSIGVPVFNEERHLAEALDSLLAQTYRNIEVVISDNASTDRTPEVCAAYAARDPRVRYHRNGENVGGIENFNAAFRLARGEFFMWSSGHDVRDPAQVARCLEVLLAEPEVVLCYTQVVWVGQGGEAQAPVHEYVDTRGLAERVARLNVVLWSLHGGFPIYGLFRSEALRRTELYTQVVSPDMSLLIELALVGRFAFIPEPPLRLRRAQDYGSWKVYVAKHFRKDVKGGSARRLYWRMVWQLCRRAARHARTPMGKATFAFFVVPAMLLNYRWMLEGLRSLGRGGED